MAEDTGPCNPVLGSQGLGARCPSSLKLMRFAGTTIFPCGLLSTLYVRAAEACGPLETLAGCVAFRPHRRADLQHPGSRRHPESAAELFRLWAGHVRVHRAPVAARGPLVPFTLAHAEPSPALFVSEPSGRKCVVSVAVRACAVFVACRALWLLHTNTRSFICTPGLGHLVFAVTSPGHRCQWPPWPRAQGFFSPGVNH